MKRNNVLLILQAADPYGPAETATSTFQTYTAGTTRQAIANPVFLTPSSPSRGNGNKISAAAMSATGIWWAGDLKTASASSACTGPNGSSVQQRSLLKIGKSRGLMTISVIKHELTDANNIKTNEVRE